MKGAGFEIGLVDGTDLAACRMYAGLAATWRGFARNAYEALGSPAALAAMVDAERGALRLPFVALPLAVVTRGFSPATALWGAAAGIAVALRTVLAIRFRAPVWTALATPVAVALMIGIQLHSYVNARLGRRVTWRSRTYLPGRPAREAGRPAVQISE